MHFYKQKLQKSLTHKSATISFSLMETLQMELNMWFIFCGNI